LAAAPIPLAANLSVLGRLQLAPLHLATLDNSLNWVDTPESFGLDRLGEDLYNQRSRTPQ
jgi:hypothetical protein